MARRGWFRLAGAALGLVVALALGEVTARLLAPTWLVNRVRDLQAGRNADDAGSDREWPVVRSGDGRFEYFQPQGHAAVAADEFRHDVNFDDVGARRTTPPREENAPIVGVIGDSFTLGVGVEDVETFSSLLAPRLGLRLVNLGIPGTALPQQLDLIERRHQAIGAPQVYVFGVYTGNDLGDIINNEREAGGKPLLVTASPAADQARTVNAWITSQPILRRSYLVQWVKAGVVTLYNAREAIPLIDSAILPMTGNETFWAEARPALGRALDRLVAVSARLHFVPIAVLLPDRYQVDDEARATRIHAYGYKDSDINPEAVNRVVTEQLRARGVKTLDLLGCLKGRRGLYYVRDIHLTREGQRSVAACLESAGLGQLVGAALHR